MELLTATVVVCMRNLFGTCQLLIITQIIAFYVVYATGVVIFFNFFFVNTLTHCNMIHKLLLKTEIRRE